MKNLVDSSGWLEFFTDGPRADEYAPAFQDVSTLIVPTICMNEVCKVILRERGEDSFFKNYVKSQETYLQEIEENFSELPIFKAHHRGEEIFGVDRLLEFADGLYQDEDPSKVLRDDSPYQLAQNSTGYELRIRLPFLENKTFKVAKYGDEIVLQIENRRKNIFLPRFVNFYQLSDHSYDAPWLIINLVK